VLALNHVGLLEVPKDLGSLSHLKDFRFRDTHPEIRRYTLPKSICMFKNLETLDLTYTMFYAMPKEICKL